MCRMDRELMLKAIQQDSSVLDHVEADLRADKDFMLAALQVQKTAIKFASTHLRADPDFMLNAMQLHLAAINFASEDLRADRDFMLAAVKRSKLALNFASKGLKGDKDFILGLVHLKGGALQYASEELRADKEVALAAMQSADGVSLKFVSESLRADREVVFQALLKDVTVLQFAANELRADGNFMTQAVQSTSEHHYAIKYASETLRADREFMQTAAHKFSSSLAFASKDLLDDREFIMGVVQKQPHALEFASKRVQADRDVVLAAILQDVTAIKYAEQPAKQDLEVLSNAGLIGFPRKKDQTNCLWIILSVKFGFHKEASPFTSYMTQALLDHEFFRQFHIYNPNAYKKSFCGNFQLSWAIKRFILEKVHTCRGLKPKDIDIHHPCRGGTCTRKSLCDGEPTDQSCWRFSYWWHLQQAKTHGGFMLQLAEYEETNDGYYLPYELGEGQKIEKEMAEILGVNVLYIGQPIGGRMRKGVGSLVASLQQAVMRCLDGSSFPSEEFRICPEGLSCHDGYKDGYPRCIVE